jgi:formate dehydrogenase beta subunit
VVVVGGGYTAMDSSRTALRLGAKTSTIVYRRGPDEMVVDEEEQHETRFEGVQFEFFASPVEVLADDAGKVKGMVFQRVRLGQPDASGRRSPEPIPGSEFTIPCDMVIPCTSQASDNNVLGEYGSKLNRHLGVTDTRTPVEGGSVSSWRTPPLNGTTPTRADGTKYNQLKFDLNRGYVVINPDSFQTNVDGVFACGDFVTGPATIIEAAGRGRRTARAVDRWLAGVRGDELEELPVINRAVVTQALEHDMPRNYEAIHRQEIPMAPPELRRDFVSLVEVGYDTRGAITEGQRCLQCNHNINIDGPRCILCGLCADVCPEGVIYMVDKAQVGGPAVDVPGEQTERHLGLDVEDVGVRLGGRRHVEEHQVHAGDGQRLEQEEADAAQAERVRVAHGVALDAHRVQVQEHVGHDRQRTGAAGGRVGLSEEAPPDGGILHVKDDRVTPVAVAHRSTSGPACWPI